MGVVLGAAGAHLCKKNLVSLLLVLWGRGPFVERMVRGDVHFLVPRPDHVVHVLDPA
jgi:hypothetical protein